MTKTDKLSRIHSIVSDMRLAEIQRYDRRRRKPDATIREDEAHLQFDRAMLCILNEVADAS